MGGETFNPFTSSVDHIVDKLLKDWHVPGCSVAITSHGRISSKGYGYSNLETKTPVEPENLFYVASITKHMFSSAFVHFIETQDQKSGPNISLETPLADIIREDFVLDTPHTTSTTTIEDALCHRTGLPRFDMTYGGPLNNPRSVTRHLRHLTLTKPPRTKLQYCNIMFMVATHALETLTSSSFADHMHETIFKPLKMKHTYSTLTDARRGQEGKHKLATPYAWENDRTVQRQLLDGPEASGAGSLISNVNDWAIWMNALMELSGPVSKQVYNEVTTPRMVYGTSVTTFDYCPWDNLVMYCLGLNRANYRGTEIFSHTGGHCGFTGNMVLIPSLKWGMISFCNCENAGGNALIALGYYLVDELLGIPIADRKDHGREMQRENESYEKQLRESKSRIYPSIPSTPAPASLPLHSYAGTFRNTAFRDFTFVAQPPTKEGGKSFLRAQPRDRFWPITLILEHVTGEFWYGRSLSLLRFGFKAEFRFDPAGRIVQLGMALEEHDEKKLWWFDKIEVAGDEGPGERMVVESLEGLGLG